MHRAFAVFLLFTMMCGNIGCSRVRCALVKGGNFYLLGVRSWTTSTLGFRPAH
jgi:hypothetical protein